MALPGQLSKYKEEYCDMVVEFLKKGYSMIEVAYDLDVNIDTLYEWKKVHKAFSEALKKGKSASEGWWMKKGRDNIDNKSFNSGLWFMNMKNRFGWSDKKEVTQDNHTTITISPETQRKVRQVLDEK